MGNSCRGSFGSKHYNHSFSKPGERPASKRHHRTEDSSVSDDTPKKPPQKQREAGAAPAAIVMRRGVDPNSNYVLGHKTPNIRDLYLVGRKLGQGQFGTTYLCTEIATGAEYACKSIAKRKLISKEDVEDVRREIQIMHHLSGHKNVVTIKGAYEDSLYVHIVMELCAGGELFDRIIERGHYSERKAAELIRVIVGVVEACHSLGVMHRDLKPENFLLVNKDDDSSLKAIDFGLSVFFKPGKTGWKLPSLTLPMAIKACRCSPAHVVRYDPTYVAKYDLTHVVRHDPSYMTRYDATHVAKYNLAHVVRYDPAHVVKYDPTHVARDNPTHVARDNPTYEPIKKREKNLVPPRAALPRFPVRRPLTVNLAIGGRFRPVLAEGGRRRRGRKTWFPRALLFPGSPALSIARTICCPRAFSSLVGDSFSSCEEKERGDSAPFYFF
ncbi:hypothetical protein B296_00058208 [Ensete ventricosum]|uniref:non-specific serine/threonine protein kinase n=1 Tax=Ensete ventricosum TaxID=4639 RepID=A0A426X4W9_ENSVE|nr:hypothetical protein B296_00058208 [Ensete ventricosum]